MTLPIFIDLDETLIHTSDPLEKRASDSVEVTVGNQKMFSSLRKNTVVLLEKLRSRGQLYLITIASHEYAQEMNRVFNLGFPEHRIFSRMHIANKQTPDISSAKVFLLDNLSRRENRLKIEFLRQISSNIIYFQIKGFLNNIYDDLSKEDIDQILKNLDEQISS